MLNDQVDCHLILASPKHNINFTEINIQHAEQSGYKLIIYLLVIIY